MIYNFAAKSAQAKSATKTDILNFMKKVYIDKKLINNKKLL